MTGRAPTVLRRLPLGTLRSWAAYAMVPLVGLVTAPILARALGPTGRGELAAILQPLSVADAFAAIGAPAAATFYFSRGYTSAAIRRPAILLMSVSATLVMAALVYYSQFIAEAAGVSRLSLVLLWSSVLIGAIYSFRRAIWQGGQNYGRLDSERALSATLRMCLIAGAAALAVGAAFSYALVYIGAGVIASIAILSKPLPRVRGDAELAERQLSSAEFARYSLLTSLSTISITLNNRLDQAVLPTLVPAHDLGLYSVAVTVAEVPMIIATVTARNLLSEVSSGASRKAIARTLTIGLGGVLALCCLLIAAAPILIGGLFGNDFSEGSPIVRILLIGTAFGATAIALSVTIAAKGRPGKGSLGPGAGALVTMALFVANWGSMTAEKASWIAVSSQFASAVVSAAILAALSVARPSDRAVADDKTTTLEE